MNLYETLKSRSNASCELCKDDVGLESFQILPKRNNDAEDHVLICTKCRSQVESDEITDVNHWRCLNESVWSEHIAVQVLSWRMLNRLQEEAWARELLDMLYLEDASLEWAKDEVQQKSEPEDLIHKDSNGARLSQGDTVTLIKDLNVKGANFIAKRGTAVRNISLVYDNENQIEGKVNGQHIVILCNFVKKN